MRNPRPNYFVDRYKIKPRAGGYVIEDMANRAIYGPYGTCQTASEAKEALVKLDEQLAKQELERRAA